MGFSGIKIVVNSYVKRQIETGFCCSALSAKHMRQLRHPFPFYVRVTILKRNKVIGIETDKYQQKGRSKIIDAKIKRKQLNKQTYKWNDKSDNWEKLQLDSNVQATIQWWRWLAGVRISSMFIRRLLKYLIDFYRHYNWPIAIPNAILQWANQITERTRLICIPNGDRNRLECWLMRLKVFVENEFNR